MSGTNGVVNMAGAAHLGAGSGFSETLKTDITFWEMGPYDPSIPTPMRLRLKLDGEIITQADVETGFLHRGFEKLLEQLPWRSVIPYADRLDPEGAAFSELALCLAVEEIAGIQVPPRASVIRIILCELNRMSAHMGYIANMAQAVGSETMVQYVLRDREKIFDLFELVAGARFALNYFRFGGVQSDVTEGFIERVLELCELMRVRLKEYNDLFTYNHAFLRRTAHIGVLSLQNVIGLGVTGPNARACGFSFDVRKNAPYSTYEKFDFEVPAGVEENNEVGDSNSRFLIRLREMAASAELLRQAADQIPLGSFTSQKVDSVLVVPAGEAYVRVESARGLLACHVVSDGSGKPSRVQFRTPSSAHLRTIPLLTKGQRLEDMPVILASLGLSISEADR